ncbi:hypothetical protein BHM03_00052045 [Ensete ventricosum]|nr:hypothetical protein BHM03_00052045 [Ensete ventricosum]
MLIPRWDPWCSTCYRDSLGGFRHQIGAVRCGPNRKLIISDAPFARGTRVPMAMRVVERGIIDKLQFLVYLVFEKKVVWRGGEQMGIVEEAHNLRVIGRADGERGTIVLAHGFGTDQSVWKHLVPHLVEDYRVVLFDNMGAGTTNPDYFDFDRYATLEGYALDLLAILEELRLGPCIFVGHSVSAAIGAIASISRPDLFSKLVMLSASPRYLNDVDYFGGFEQEELDQLFDAMRSNYKAWVSGFAPLAVGGDMDSVAVQEFSRTLFNIRPDIALCVAQTIFQSDLREILGLVMVPCHILQSSKDLAVPVVVSEYLHRNLGGESIVEVMSSEGHLPQLSSPDIVIPVLLRHIRYDIAV